jgi:signal transduction histidine kinase
MRALPSDPDSLDETPDPDDLTWTLVSSGSRNALIPSTLVVEATSVEQPMRVRRVFLQVTAAAVLVVLAVVIAGGIASRRLAEREAVNAAAAMTSLLATSVITPVLDDGLLTGSAASIARLDSVVRAQILAVGAGGSAATATSVAAQGRGLGSDIIRVKIWNSDGKILYSDVAAAIGMTFPLDEDQRDIMENPRVRAEVTDGNRIENQFEAGQGRLLEVYHPVWTPSGEPLVFETYSRYDVVTARARDLWRGFAGLTTTSLLLLVVLLLPLLWAMFDRLRQAQVQRVRLLEGALDASSQERRRIAATLHDGAVQELAAASFAVAGAAEQARGLGQERLAADLHSAAATVRAGIGSLRSLLVDIYPPSLQSAGLTAALEDLLTFVRSRRVAAELDITGDVSALGQDEQRLVHRVAQECLRNAVRHSGATSVLLSLVARPDALELDIADDGAGFDVDEVLSAPAEGHFGLRVMADLVAMSGGELAVRSAPGRGTTWKLTVALGRRR